MKIKLFVFAAAAGLLTVFPGPAAAHDVGRDVEIRFAPAHAPYIQVHRYERDYRHRDRHYRYDRYDRYRYLHGKGHHKVHKKYRRAHDRWHRHNDHRWDRWYERDHALLHRRLAHGHRDYHHGRYRH